MPFTLQQYQSPYIGTIADLMQGPARAQAQALRQSADAQARAAESSGQAWGNAIGTIGQLVSRLPGQIQDAQQQQQTREFQSSRDARETALADSRLKGDALEQEQRQGEMAAHEAARTSAAEIKQKNDTALKIASGLRDPDPQQREVVLREIRDPQVQQLARGLLKSRDDQNDAYRKERAQYAQKLDYNPDIVRVLVAMDPLPHALDHFNEMTDGGTNQAKVQQYVNAIATIGDKPAADYTLNPGDQRRSGPTNALLATAPPKVPETKPPMVGSFEDYVTRKFGPAPTPAQIETARKGYAASDNTADTAAVKLSGPGLDAAAQMYAQTGQLPPMGMGAAAAGSRTAIINRAAELFPGLNIAGNKAGYGADSGSLGALTKQRDAIGAFEQTAKKNIDIFLETAGKVVDTGSPLANRAARTLSGSVLGSGDQAAYDAARQVAISEIAKIVQNPALTGQLSDSARHEIEVFNPSNATLKQTVAVMRLLKRDMTNRATSLDDQIRSIRGRLSGGQGAGADPLGIR